MTGLIFGLVCVDPFSHAADAKFLCEVEDASDRNYLERVLGLIAGAEQSIDLSMFAVGLTGDPKDPGTRLIEALKSSRQRGVEVRLWLNARQASIGASRVFMQSSLQHSLQEIGIQIFYVNPNFRLHDKLIVIDKRIVIDGSMNWTREALLKNYESASVIESSTLAAKKIRRLESLPLLQKEQTDIESETPAFSFALELLKDPKKFPAALEGREIRSLALYLLLLQYAHHLGQNSFEIGLETWGERLPFRKRWIGTSLRHEIRRNLGFLKEKYALMDWQMRGKESALVTMKPVSSSVSIKVPLKLIEAGYLKTLSTNGLFVYLLTLHKAEVSGHVPFWLGSVADVADEFHLSTVTLIRGLWELKRSNLIEIFPWEKKEVNGVWQREFTNRYILNPILMPDERTRKIEALEKKFRKELVTKARELADSIDDPEDPEVIRQMIHLYRSYKPEEVEEATRIVAGFNRNNALRTPAYIRGILEAGGLEGPSKGPR